MVQKPILLVQVNVQVTQPAIFLVNVWIQAGAKAQPKTATKTKLEMKVKAEVTMMVSGCEEEERT